MQKDGMAAFEELYKTYWYRLYCIARRQTASSQDAEELVRYAVRRGLIGPDEGDRVLVEVQEGLRKKKPVAVKKAPAKKKKGAARR